MPSASLPATGKRILVVQLERLGDLVQTTPLIMDLRRTDPSAKIDLLVWSEFAPIVEGLPGVTLRTMPSRRVKEINDEIQTARSLGRQPEQAPRAEAELGLPAYDWVINVSHELFASWLSARLARVREGGGLTPGGEWLYSGDWLTFLVSQAAAPGRNPFNLVDVYRGCAAAGPPDYERAHVACEESLPFELPAGRLAVLAPGASEEQRRFNSNVTLQIIPQLESMGFKIVLAGAPSDQEFGRSITDAASVPVTNLTGKTSVQQLAEVLRRADIVVTADSGPAHIAAALGRPLVGLYGACLAPLTTAPWGPGHLILVAGAMQRFSCGLVMEAIRTRLGMTASETLRHEALTAGVEAWRAAMLPGGADPLGGVTYLPLHADRLDTNSALRRLMRHVMASIIHGRPLGNMAHLASLAPPAAPQNFGVQGNIRDCEQQLSRLAYEVGRGLLQFRKRRLDGLRELAGRVAATIERLKNDEVDDPVIAPAILFLDWKLRMMPPYGPERVFQENERELKRAAQTLGMARKAAEAIWPSIRLSAT